MARVIVIVFCIISLIFMTCQAYCFECNRNHKIGGRLSQCSDKSVLYRKRLREKREKAYDSIIDFVELQRKLVIKSIIDDKLKEDETKPLTRSERRRNYRRNNRLYGGIK